MLQAARWVAFSALILLTGAKCGSATRALAPRIEAKPFWPEQRTSRNELLGARLQWKVRAGGAITDLAFSAKGNAIIIATVPDPDVQGSLQSQAVTRWSPQGKVVWRTPVKATTKGLAVSDDASLVVVSNYSDEIRGLDARGKPIWLFEGMCRPIILSKLRRVACYHDDDAEPFVAFDWLGWNGEKLFSHPIKRDILALKVSEDERLLALALTEGIVQVFKLSAESVPQLLWEGHVDGEISDLDVGPSRVVALASNRSGKQTLTLWNDTGVVVGQAFPSARMTQVDIPIEGDFAVTYGNSTQGQHVAFFVPGETQTVWTEKWTRGSLQPAEYSSHIAVYKDHTVIGVEDIESSGRHSHLLSIGRGGELRWDIPLWDEEGAYLYSRGYSDGIPLMAIGTDDGILRAFQIQNP